jgi:Fe-S-cluster containining protein
VKLDIAEGDITSELCERCAACCRVKLDVVGTNSRYRAFLRKLGYAMTPVSPPGEADCCVKVHDVTLDMGWCKHLEISGAEPSQRLRCGVYNTSDRPALCADYSCVGWAKASDSYNETNPVLAKAQESLDQLRREREKKAASSLPA